MGNTSCVSSISGSTTGPYGILENRPQWKDELARLDVKIEHSEFDDEHGIQELSGCIFSAPWPAVCCPAPAAAEIGTVTTLACDESSDIKESMA